MGRRRGARERPSRAEIRSEIEGRFGYDLSRRIEEIRPACSFDVTCQGSVPEALYGGVPAEVEAEAERRLDDRIRGTMEEFARRFVR